MIPFSMFQLAMYDVAGRSETSSRRPTSPSPRRRATPGFVRRRVHGVVVSQPGDTLLSTMNKGRAKEMLQAEPPCITDACSAGDLDVAVAVGDSADWLERVVVDGPVTEKAAEGGGRERCWVRR